MTTRIRRFLAALTHTGPGYQTDPPPPCDALCGDIERDRDAWQQRAKRAEARIRLARHALIRDGYFTADEIGDDIAPRITEWLTHHRDRAEQAEQRAAEATAELTRSENARDHLRARAQRAERRAELSDAVTAETKRHIQRRTNTLRQRAERAETGHADLRAALAEALAAFSTTATQEPGGSPIGYLAESPVHPNDYNRWRAALDAAALDLDGAEQADLRAERDTLGRETDRLRRGWTTMRDRAEQAETALACLHEGEELPTDERAEQTPGQWLWRWNRVTPTERLDLIARVQDAAARADRCFLGNHEKRIPELEEHRAALGRVRALAERWQYTGDRKGGPLPELRAALDAPQAGDDTTGDQR